MITGDIVVLRPAAQNVAPGVALPAGPQGSPGPAGADGAPGANGLDGSPGLPGVIQSFVGLSKAAITQQDVAAILTAIVAALPTTLPSQSGVLWINGGVFQIS